MRDLLGDPSSLTVDRSVVPPDEAEVSEDRRPFRCFLGLSDSSDTGMELLLPDDNGVELILPDDTELSGPGVVSF